jgi:hypothetical protein
LIVEESFVRFTKFKGCSNRIIQVAMPLSSLIAIANFKAILDFIKDFLNLPAFRLVASFIISETSFFWKEFVLRK